MTKSFLIALAGFAIGLGVTAALMFISPGPGMPDRVATAPAAKSPVAEQRLVLTPAPPLPAAASVVEPEVAAPSAAVEPPPPP
ncbi:MAG: hypothetical protein O2967_22135, partial [Proteobacteria bacterium]|nr:hypothetical protein [Pseudomonadota bacterium]